MRAIALAPIAALAVSCGGAPPPIDFNDKLRKENEITALWTQIRDFRREAHMPLDPPRTMLFQWENRPVQEAKRVCTDGHEVPATCNDVCDLSDAICDNAEAICGIADDLGKDDTYAQEKCASAKASCREAKQRCCDCSGVGK